MAVKEASAFCPTCERQVLIRSQGIDHLFYLVLTLLCGGITLVFWLADCLTWKPTWRCMSCGTICKGPVDTTARAMAYGLILIVGAVALMACGIVGIRLLLDVTREAPRDPLQSRPIPADAISAQQPEKADWDEPGGDGFKWWSPTPLEKNVAVPDRTTESPSPKPPIETAPPRSPKPDPPLPDAPVIKGAIKPSARGAPVASKPPPPATITLNASRRFLTVGTSAAALQECGRLAVAGDEAGIREMTASGKLIEVKEPVAVVKLNVVGEYTYFRFAEGPHDGKAGVLRTIDFK